MVTPVEGAVRVSFGLYELDPQTGELWKAGFRVRLQSQPFKILTALLATPGEVVTREDLQLLVWGRDTNVDFDRSLGTAVNKLRDAHGDSAENPRFIETLAKRGYRFIAPVTMTPKPPVNHILGKQPGHAGYAVPDIEPERAMSPAIEVSSLHTSMTGPEIREQESGPDLERGWRDLGSRLSRSQTLVAAGILALAALLAGVALGRATIRSELGMGSGFRTVAGPLRVDQVTHNARISSGAPNMESLPTFVTDGVRIFASTLEEGRPRLSVLYTSSGVPQSVTLPQELSSVSISDLSPDGSKLLLRSFLSTASEQPVWVVPATGGSALRVGDVLAHDASWMPDGKSILYAAGDDLSLIGLNDGVSTLYARVPGRAFSMRWSPDGKTLRFTLMDPLTHTSSIWEMDGKSRIPRPLLARWAHASSTCCGTWTADGSTYVFQSGRASRSDLWQMRGRGSQPVPLTNGPLSYGSPVAARMGRRIYFLGLDMQSEIQRLSANGREFQTEKDFLEDANRVDYSRDREWVAWADSEGRLWRARAKDGSEKLQLTSDYLEVFLAHWSPDGRRLALMARETGKPWQVYVVSMDGGTPEHILPESRNQADPGWSPDGKTLVFGREPDLMGKESGSHAIELLNLGTKQVSTLPNSDGLFSPRWSPDGRWIAALSLDQRRVVLFEVRTQGWREILAGSAADPVWAADSSGLYVHEAMSSKQPIVQIDVPTGEVRTVATLDNFRAGETADYFFVGVTPEGVPLVRARVATGDLYTMDLGGQ